MHEMTLEYDRIDIPSCHDIVKYTIGGTSREDYERICAEVLDEAEIIMTIPCLDGWVVIVRHEFATTRTERKSEPMGGRCNEESK